jgi:hypothetical protein
MEAPGGSLVLLHLQDVRHLLAKINNSLCF